MLGVAKVSVEYLQDMIRSRLRCLRSEFASLLYGSSLQSMINEAYRDLGDIGTLLDNQALDGGVVDYSVFESWTVWLQCRATEWDILARQLFVSQNLNSEFP